MNNSFGKCIQHYFGRCKTSTHHRYYLQYERKPKEEKQDSKMLNDWTAFKSEKTYQQKQLGLRTKLWLKRTTQQLVENRVEKRWKLQNARGKQIAPPSSPSPSPSLLEEKQNHLHPFPLEWKDIWKKPPVPNNHPKLQTSLKTSLRRQSISAVTHRDESAPYGQASPKPKGHSQELPAKSDRDVAQCKHM